MKNRDPCPVALNVSKHELYVNILEYNNFLKLQEWSRHDQTMQEMQNRLFM